MCVRNSPTFPRMFARTATRAVSKPSSLRLVGRDRRRGFATHVNSAPIRVAAVDHGQATTSVTFVLKAGSRYETKAGAAHALKNFAFKVS